MRRRMNFQIGQLDKLLATIAAGIIFQLLKVSFDVSSQIVFKFERFVADRAQILLLVVRLHVNVQMSLRRERPITNLALKLLQAQMNILVIQEILFAFERLWAKRACISLKMSFRVDSLMSLEVASQEKLLLADFAGEFVDPRVLRRVFS